jgi:hypothetical protein
MRSTFIVFFFQFLTVLVFSQEVLNDLVVNPALVNKKPQASYKSAKAARELPFFDDFSIISGYPTNELWQDFNVFVNETYGINPPSIGVATFDGVNSQGFVYEHLSENPSLADELTSQPINLSAANPNTTYLSFYYQPQGHGNAPEYNDSLVLNVIVNDTVIRIWHANGTDYKSFKKDSLGIPEGRPDTLEFKLVYLKLDNPLFFTDNFQLQFANYVSIADLNNQSMRTNSDHWNIDCIKLDDGRSPSETIFKDLAMVKPSTLFMRDYSSIPWNHFKSTITGQLNNVMFFVRNNDSEPRSLTQLIVNVKDLNTGTLNDYYIGQKNMNPFENSGEDLSWNFTSSPIDWYPADSAVFEITGEIKTDTEDSIDNNFSSRIINFKNYYAYDDGTAESAYGVDNSRARVAYQYEIQQGDSLKAVQMYFVRPLSEEAGVQSFTLCVWDDYNGKPGDVILKESGKHPIYSDNLDEFVTISFDSTLYLEGTFYIGWEQNTDLMMNVGYDANTSRQKKLFYNISSVWYESEFKGSLMMRPVFNADPLVTSISEKPTNKTLQVAPNPSNGSLHIINQSEFTFGTVTIFNYLGKKVFEKQMNTSETLDVSHLINGMYIITFAPENDTPVSTRLILTK